MKPYFLVALVVCFGAISCKQKIDTKNVDSAPKQALLEALEAFNQGFATGDLARLDSMTTDNYLHTNGNSEVISKSDWFNYLQKRNKQLQSGEIAILKYQLDERKIEYHGNTAIVTGKVSVVTKDSSQTKESQYRVTNIWVFEEGQWKRAGFHDGKIR